MFLGKEQQKKERRKRKEGRKGQKEKKEKKGKKVRERKGKEKRVNKLWNTLFCIVVCYWAKNNPFLSQKAENLVLTILKTPMFIVVWDKQRPNIDSPQKSNNFCTRKHNWACSKCMDVLPLFLGVGFFLGWCFLVL